jgi:hypothetical protein
MLFIFLNLYSLEKILEETKINYFNKIKTEIKQKLKNEYFIQIDTNDLNVIDSIKTLKELKKYLHFLTQKYHIIDYNYILLLKKEKEEKQEKRYDNGIDEKTGKYIPGSPALKYCYYFSKKIIKNLEPEYYEKKKNDVCIYNKNVFISSYEINEELANIFIDLSRNDVFYDTIVIDFIENPGGLLDVSNIIISILTGEKVITQDFFSRDTIFRISTLIVTNSPLKYKMLIFLSNKNSASASEYIMFKTYEILKNQKGKKIKIINKDNRTIGKKTVQMIYNVGITQKYLSSLKDSLLSCDLPKFYYPFITDTTYLINLFQKELQEFIDLEFIYTIYVMIYYDPLNKEVNEKIKDIEKRAKYVKEFYTFIIYFKL